METRTGANTQWELPRSFSRAGEMPPIPGPSEGEEAAEYNSGCQKVMGEKAAIVCSLTGGRAGSLSSRTLVCPGPCPSSGSPVLGWGWVGCWLAHDTQDGQLCYTPPQRDSLGGDRIFPTQILSKPHGHPRDSHLGSQKKCKQTLSQGPHSTYSKCTAPHKAWKWEVKTTQSLDLGS